MRRPLNQPALETLTFLDPAVQECPYPAYDLIREEAPAFYDRLAGFWVITRYEDVRAVVMDPARFSSAGTVELVRQRVDPGRAAAARAIYEAEGWVPAPTLSLLDDPRHREVRKIFEHALRAGRIRELDPYIETIAHQLVDEFAPRGTCDAVRDYAVPLPLMAICSQVGVPMDDVWTIKRWTDAWMRRFSLMQTPDEEAASVRQEIEFQHYFADIVADLRKAPNGSLLSDLVNMRLSDGAALGYAEIASHLLSDIFVGGSETTTNAIAEGVLLLCRNEDQYRRLSGDLDRRLRGFIEETLRLETPVQTLYRITTEAVEIGGVAIPAGEMISLRFGAANRDARHFACPADLDLDRRNSGSHLAFGAGIHHCIGAPLARREMFWAFDVLLRRCRNIRMASGHDAPAHQPGAMLRVLKELPIAFDPA